MCYKGAIVARVVVVGAGMMGSALCVPLADRGHEVHLVGTALDDGIVAELKRGLSHPGLGVALPGSIRPHPVSALGSLLEQAEWVGLGVSSAGLPWASRVLSGALSRSALPIVMITKGLQLAGGSPGQGSEPAARVLTDALARGTGAQSPPHAICGPCIAGELARRVPTAVVLAGGSEQTRRWFAEQLRTEYYRVLPHSDTLGVQACAALKNAYAMGVALAAGLHERRVGSGGSVGSVAFHNLEAALFAQSAREMAAVAAWLGGEGQTAAGLAGVGDLNVTCVGGRTGRFGRLLGAGLGRREAQARMRGATLECLEILSLVERLWGGEGPLAGRRSLPPKRDLPLLAHLVEVALHDAPAAPPLSRFFGAS